MVSAFQSRESGWGIEISDEQSHQVNLNQRRKLYFDQEAAQTVLSTAEKVHSPNHHLFKLLNLAVLMVIGQVTTPLSTLKAALIV